MVLDDDFLARRALLDLTGGKTAADWIAVEMPNGSIEPFQFHVACYPRNPYLLIAAPPIADGIHVLAVVSNPDALTADLVGWCWAQTLRAQPYTSAGSKGGSGHAIARRYLRKMSEIRPRILGPTDASNAMRA